ncbi:MAG: hypothetical protein HYU77_08435 [Betaproteobacteria bacterium]|nr:hypothetical protein [Betaproteobacteria bacterium]
MRRKAKVSIYCHHAESNAAPCPSELLVREVWVYEVIGKSTPRALRAIHHDLTPNGTTRTVALMVAPAIREIGTAMTTCRELVSYCSLFNHELFLCGATGDTLERLRAEGVLERIKEERIFPTAAEMVSSFAVVQRATARASGADVQDAQPAAGPPGAEIRAAPERVPPCADLTEGRGNH